MHLLLEDGHRKLPVYLGSDQTNVFDEVGLHHLSQQAVVGGGADERGTAVGWANWPSP